MVHLLVINQTHQSELSIDLIHYLHVVFSLYIFIIFIFFSTLTIICNLKDFKGSKL